MAIGITKQMNGTLDNKRIYAEVLCAGSEYLKMAFMEGSREVTEGNVALEKVWKKLSKVASKKTAFLSELSQTRKDCFSEAKRGVSAVATNDLSGALEDFLTQSKGALDILSKHFLKALVGYPEKWYCNKIALHIEGLPNVDQGVASELAKMIREDDATWLKEMIEDRNSHHDDNLPISNMVQRDGMPTAVLTRANGQKTADLEGYVEELFDNLLGMVREVIQLTVALYQPALRHLPLKQGYFFPDDE